MLGLQQTRSYSGSAALLALCATSLATAQEESTTQNASTEFESVVVTARRVSEDVQRVPLTVSVISPESLQSQQVDSLYDLVRVLPGFDTCCSTATLGGGSWIRGVPGGNTYFAGVPISSALQIAFFDAANVQGLKGPQGTLFGLNNTAGAIVIEPQLPSNAFEGYINTEVGTQDHTALEGAINIPLVTDKVLLRVGGKMVQTDGFVKDLQHNKGLYDENYWIGRAALTINPTEGFSNTTLVNFFHRDENSGIPIAIPLVRVRPDGPAITVNTAQGYTFQGMTPTQIWEEQSALGRYATLGTNTARGTYNKVDQWHVANTTEYTVNSALTIKNIFGYQQVKTEASGDWDGTPLPVLENCPDGCGVSGPVKTYSDELQLLARLLDERLTFIVGSFNQYSASTGPYPVQYQRTLGTLRGSTTRTKARTNGLYASGTYDLRDWVDGLSVTAGYRYNWDYRFQAGCSFTGAGALIACSPIQEKEWTNSNYNLSLEYQLSDQTMVYLTNSTGSRSGGFNSPNLPITAQSFGPEDLNAIELGIKSIFDLGSTRWRTNLAGWYGWYEGMQLQDTRIDDNGNFITYINNVGKGLVQGVEAQITARLTRALELSVNGVWNNNHLTDYSVAGVDRTSQPFIYSPRWSYNVGGTVYFPTPATVGDVSASVVYDYHGRIFSVSTFPVIPEDSRPAFDKVALNVSWNNIMGNSGLSAVFAVTNLLDDDKESGQFVGWVNLGVLGYSPARPRMYTLSLRYGF